MDTTPFLASATPLLDEAKTLVLEWERAQRPASIHEIVKEIQTIAVVVAGRDDGCDTAAKLTAYADDLINVPHAVLQAACLKLRRICKWFPALSEVWEAINELVEPHKVEAIRVYALAWLAENPKADGFTDWEWWNYRALKAGTVWAENLFFGAKP